MKISGQPLAQELYSLQLQRISALKEKDIVPHLAIVQSNQSDAVSSYIQQKIKTGETIGVDVEVVDFSPELLSDPQNVKDAITRLNARPEVHGIILQKPSHAFVNEEVEQLIDPVKDIDGFRSNSSHTHPIYLSVVRVLQAIITDKFHGTSFNKTELFNHLKSYSFVVVGKGKTGGGPVISGLQKDGIPADKIKVVDSKTTQYEKEQWLREADVVISAVGSSQSAGAHLFSSKTILIDIGIHFDKEKNIRGDYDEEAVKDIVAYYTTTPGGIGSLIVAYLMDNVITAAEKLT